MANDGKNANGLRLPLPVPRGRAGEGVCRSTRATRSAEDPLPNPPPAYREREQDRRGFTLFELLIATAVVGLILVSVVPFIVKLREEGRRAECVSNLKLIRDGLKSYLIDNKSYPRVRYDEARQPEGWTAFTGPDAADPFADGGGVKPNDVTASLWLLVRNGYISDPSAFVCPSSGDWADPLVDAKGERTIAKKRGNFRSGHNLSYSVFCMFGSTIGTGDRNVWTDTLPGDCVLLADKNPGTAGGNDVTAVAAGATPEAFARANSRNHGHALQNVLYADGSVQPERNPYVGVGYKRSEKASAAVPGDNIFTALQARPIPPGQKPDNFGKGVTGRAVSPAWQYDSYLVPTAED